MRRMMPLVCLVFLAFVVPRDVRAAGPEGVDRAVERGVDSLKSLQQFDGTWPYEEIGATALAGLTLLECAVPADDPVIQKAADAVRLASVNLTHTYSLALSVLFLDRLGDPLDVSLIESMTVRLLAGQDANGGWTYSCPNLAQSEVRRLSNLLNQRRELVAGRELPKPGSLPKRTAKDLPLEIQQQLKLLNQQQAAGGGLRNFPSDNSNTQFATLALWVARRHGLPTDQAINRIKQRFRASQNADGGWGYRLQGGRAFGGSTATMTCAGLLGLAVGYGAAADAILHTDPKAKAAAGGAKPQPDPTKDAAVRAGLLALSTVVGDPVGDRQGRPLTVIDTRGRLYYFLWSLERVAVIFGLKTIGNKDWYGWGAEILLANQNPDGSWTGAFAECGADTCFALLFLKRANLARDLTASLKGAVEDPGEAVLKAGGLSGTDPKPGKTKLDLSSDEEKPAETTRRQPEDKPAPKPAPAQPQVQPKPQPPQQKEETLDAGRLGEELVRAAEDKQSALLDKLRDAKGGAFTTALARAIPKLTGATKVSARDALAERFTRMTAATLKDKLKDDDLEVRRAAALAVAMKEDASFVPRLIELLQDPEPPVARAAHAALKALTKQELAPDPAAWKAWAAHQGK